jgi:hypothetical protein
MQRFKEVSHACTGQTETETGEGRSIRQKREWISVFDLHYLTHCWLWKSSYSFPGFRVLDTENSHDFFQFARTRQEKAGT